MESEGVEETQKRWIGKDVEDRRKERNRKKKKYEWEGNNGRKYKVRLGWR